LLCTGDLKLIYRVDKWEEVKQESWYRLKAGNYWASFDMFISVSMTMAV